MRAGQQDLHLHAAVGRVAQPVREILVGNEVRGRDAHAAAAPTATACGTASRRRSIRSRTRRARTARSIVAGLGLVREPVDASGRRAPGRSRPSCRGTRRAARRPRDRGSGSACRATRASSRASPFHSSAMPTPPVNPIDSSTTITLRCVRWLTVPSSEPAQRPEPPHEHAGRDPCRRSAAVHRVRTPRVEQHAHPYAGARPLREPAARTRSPISPLQYTNVRKSIVCSAPSIASSIAGKISSPLRSTSMRLPSVAGTPITPSRVRRSSSTRSLTWSC